uniref:Uncharacterized protein n=1 Tax=Oryza brachyantha TaxID=4533 RepID=J3L2G8_ORYBR
RKNSPQEQTLTLPSPRAGRARGNWGIRFSPSSPLAAVAAEAMSARKKQSWMDGDGEEETSFGFRELFLCLFFVCSNGLPSHRGEKERGARLGGRKKMRIFFWLWLWPSARGFVQLRRRG